MDSLKTLLPFLSVVTFIAGYLLSNLDRLREARRKLRNMKMILFKEMSENYKLLNKLVPLNETQFPDATVVAVFAQRFSFAVYDRYLDQLDQLQTSELSKIYEACVMLKGLQSDSAAFLTESGAADATTRAKQDLAARATLVLAVIHKCHELLTEALRVLPEGSAFLRAQESDRGSILQTEKQVSSLLRDDKLNRMDR